MSQLDAAIAYLIRVDRERGEIAHAQRHVSLAGLDIDDEGVHAIEHDLQPAVIDDVFQDDAGSPTSLTSLESWRRSEPIFRSLIPDADSLARAIEDAIHCRRPQRSGIRAMTEIEFSLRYSEFREKLLIASRTLEIEPGSSVPVIAGEIVVCLAEYLRIIVGLTSDRKPDSRNDLDELGKLKSRIDSIVSAFGLAGDIRSVVGRHLSPDSKINVGIPVESVRLASG